jgi:hypothetical protein
MFIPTSPAAAARSAGMVIDLDSVVLGKPIAARRSNQNFWKLVPVLRHELIGCSRV